MEVDPFGFCHDLAYRACAGQRLRSWRPSTIPRPNHCFLERAKTRWRKK
jgi:hypothetical protein